MKFTGSHILSIGQFERADIERIFEVADQMEAVERKNQQLQEKLDDATQSVEDFRNREESLNQTLQLC